MHRSKYLATVVLLLTSVNSFASGNLLDQIERCSLMNESEARLTCFDEMAKSVSASKGTAAGSTPSQHSMPASVPPAVVQEKAAITPPTPTVAEQFGFENKQKAAAKKETDRLYVDVTSIKKDRLGMLTIYLSNNQIWKQIGTNRYFYKEAQGKAYLERGSMNSFFFSQDEIKRRIRVKRLQ